MGKSICPTTIKKLLGGNLMNKKFNKDINYNGTQLKDLYALAAIGSEFIVEQNENVAVINSLKKQLYMKTVLLSRLLNIVAIAEDKVMSLDEYNTYDITTSDLKGKGLKRLMADYAIFVDLLDDEITNLLAIKNDLFNRLDQELKIATTPEALKQLEKQKQEALKMVEDLKGKE